MKPLIWLGFLVGGCTGTDPTTPPEACLRSSADVPGEGPLRLRAQYAGNGEVMADVPATDSQVCFPLRPPSPNLLQASGWRARMDVTDFFHTSAWEQPTVHLAAWAIEVGLYRDGDGDGDFRPDDPTTGDVLVAANSPVALYWLEDLDDVLGAASQHRIRDMQPYLAPSGHPFLQVQFHDATTDRPAWTQLIRWDVLDVRIADLWTCHTRGFCAEPAPEAD